MGQNSKRKAWRTTRLPPALLQLDYLVTEAKVSEVVWKLFMLTLHIYMYLPSLFKSIVHKMFLSFCLTL